MKNLRTGAVQEKTFRSTEKVEKAQIDSKNMQYLYADGDNYVFMDTDTYDQLTLPGDEIRDQLNYLKENMNVKIIMHGNETLGIELPKTVDRQLKKPNRVFVAIPVAAVQNRQPWKPVWLFKCHFSLITVMC